MFHTLKYAKMLEEVGFSREQAETSIKVLVEVMEDKLASKQDVLDLEQELQLIRQEIQQVKQDTRRDIQDLEKKLDYSIAQLRSDLTVRMGTMLAASIAILATVQKLL